MGDLWNVNPTRAVLLFNKHKGGLDPIWWNVEFIGFSDGAWERSGDDISLSRIGGLIIDHKKKVVFTFSGKSSASSSLKVEKHAILFLYQYFKASPFSKCSPQMYTYSMTLTHGILQARAGFNLDSPILRGDDWVYLVKDKSTKVSFINKNMLHGADRRAKEGKRI